MAAKLVECEHCQGKKNCSRSGGRSCAVCLEASGHGKRGWATVRCSYCGGRGRVWMKEEPAPEAETEEVPQEQGAEETPAEE